MNKKKIKEIKDIIGYDSNIPEHKRLVRALKKQYQRLNGDARSKIILELRKSFNKDE